MSHVVDSCPNTRLDSGLQWLHEADEGAVNWLDSMMAKTLAK